MSYYDVLGVTPEADVATVHEAWRRAREAAPSGGLDWLVAWFDGRTRADIDEAYTVLSDPAARAWHDRQCAITEAVAGYRCWS